MAQIEQQRVKHVKEIDTRFANTLNLRHAEIAMGLVHTLNESHVAKLTACINFQKNSFVAYERAEILACP